MNKVFKKTIKVIAIIGAYLISMIGSSIIGSAITAVALEQKKREEVVKTEVKKETEEKKVNKERSDENISYGFSRENLEELRKLGEKYKD
jgi:hypothetical protein